ncbi:MAG: MBL fold metallo-hydrolase [Lysobacterales bacterium]|nr:MAG: MBL fold metallo-hydrolase [Xanthomonadales bacterium]
MHTATLVEYRGTRVMIDCGETWLGRLDDLRPDAIVITHAHPDHAFGLKHGSPCPVYATRSAWRALRRFPIPPCRRRTLRLRDSVAIGRIAVEAFSVVHSIRAPAVGYRVSAGRVKVFYVPDVVSIRARSEALRDISVYIGDGAAITRNMVRRERKTGTPIGHTPISRQLDWCRDEGVPRMIVTHCGSDIVGRDEAAAIARLETLAALRGVAIAIAHDGMELVLR